MGPLGLPEMLFILVLALLVFGPKRLPEMGRKLGRGLAEFRRAANEFKRTVNTELALDEIEDRPKPKPRPQIAQTAPRPGAGAPEAAATAPAPAQPSVQPVEPATPSTEPAAEAVPEPVPGVEPR